MKEINKFNEKQNVQVLCVVQTIIEDYMKHDIVKIHYDMEKHIKNHKNVSFAEYKERKIKCLESMKKNKLTIHIGQLFS